MNYNELKYKANYYAIILFAFVIPLERKLAPPLIILFFITSLFNHRFKSSNSINKIYTNKSVLLFSVLFLLYVFGLFFSSDIENGFRNITEKLSLLIFPISFYISNINFREKSISIFRSFIEGCIVSVIICIFSSTIGYYFTHDSSWFFYGSLSVYLHSSYFAMFLSLAIVIIYLNLYNRDNIQLYKPIIAVLFILLFSIIIILLASKTGLITLLLIHVTSFTVLTIKHKAYLKGLIALTCLALIFYASYSNSITLQGRVNELIYVVQSGDNSNKSTTAVRSKIWKIAIHLIKEKPIFGYGTGNEKGILIEKYNENQLYYFAKEGLNAHNQFLQTAIALGLVGGLTLLLMLIIPFILSIKNHYYLYAFFVLLITLNFLTESILERQSGVVFYAFFNTLLCSIFVKKTSIKNDTILTTTH